LCGKRFGNQWFWQVGTLLVALEEHNHSFQLFRLGNRLPSLSLSFCASLAFQDAILLESTVSLWESFTISDKTHCEKMRKLLGKLASEDASVALIRAGDQLFFSSQSLMYTIGEKVTLCLYKFDAHKRDARALVLSPSALHSQQSICNLVKFLPKFLIF